ncbi:hypothetical protein DFH08DRAFT_800224 [Mycena albidolilacea]|uniref:Uncharacterized protein n=1 Tax=Mycena albidolilacea TaxID=1033008 RepID=A0AAD7AJI3_9AGAR|nr:hypothetical protein DFH08DRAFT_800224 [Mycena albidolilacea]
MAKTHPLRFSTYVHIVTPAWVYFVSMKAVINHIAVERLSSRVYHVSSPTTIPRPGNLIPEESANAPLRFRLAEHEPPAGPVLCHTGCTTKGGDSEQQTYREHCKVHKVPAVVGCPITDARTPAPHAAAAAAPVQPPQPTPALPPIPSYPSCPISSCPGCGTGPRKSSRKFSLPLPWNTSSLLLWHQIVLNKKGPDPKAERQWLEKLKQQSCDFVFYHTRGKPATKFGHTVTHYPKMQLSSTPLLQGLGMTENSWIDIYNYAVSSWKTLQATAVFLVDGVRGARLRISKKSTER